MALRFKNDAEFKKWLGEAEKLGIRDITNPRKEALPKVEDSYEPNDKYSSELYWVIGFLVGLFCILAGIFL